MRKKIGIWFFEIGLNIHYTPAAYIGAIYNVLV
jgi:hypothetical protein